MLAAFARVIRSLLFTLILASAPASGMIFDHDDRVTRSAVSGSPYAPIGLVWADKLATGFLVDNCHVLTVQHVFSGKQSAIGRQAFFGALILDQGHWTASLGKVVAAGGLENHSTNYDAARVSDWALLRLQTCLGARIGYVRLVEADRETLPQLQSAGYPADRKNADGVTIDPDCRVLGARAGLWLNDCAAVSGNSGSPIFSESQDKDGQRLQVYAIQSAAYEFPDHSLPFDTGYANIATPIGIILPHIANL